ncbi:MAG: hypothetical protein Q8L92_08835, partial [Rubrivivax sp.]|nr:hypothetical protein [Rubrivivax sp.]
IERLVISTSASGCAADGKDALNEFRSFIAEAGCDTGLRMQIDADIGELVRKLPHDVKIELEGGILKAAADRDHEEIIGHASRYLAARLSSEGV